LPRSKSVSRSTVPLSRCRVGMPMCAKSTQWRLTRTTALRAWWTSSGGNFQATYSYCVIDFDSYFDLRLP
jgi:hypothetical protein